MARQETSSFTDTDVSSNQALSQECLGTNLQEKFDMKSNRTPYTKLGNTINAVTVTFSVGRTKHEVQVPAGTRCCLLDGPNQRWVVDDLSFIDSKSGVFTDASNYGIPIDPVNLTNIRQPTA